ncbi:hypothetical protein SKAU_G00125250 [Synaphobranchus kaupii]|uniref:Uncharacterized protein n=1 Tax=Synaphobranchus kaupii TaxID=118154 RepID=A0A9Q1J1U6_SYNKA|nr:hypothetical protein SKAU_G00125250 [Synaphobranchus kaupii]
MDRVHIKRLPGRQEKVRQVLGYQPCTQYTGGIEVEALYLNSASPGMERSQGLFPPGEDSFSHSVAGKGSAQMFSAYEFKNSLRVESYAKPEPAISYFLLHIQGRKLQGRVSLQGQSVAGFKPTCERERGAAMRIGAPSLWMARNLLLPSRTGRSRSPGEKVSSRGEIEGREGGTRTGRSSATAPPWGLNPLDTPPPPPKNNSTIHHPFRYD